jgi:LacI family transcriptional regulator
MERGCVFLSPCRGFHLSDNTTIGDIAKSLNISRSTVSNAITGTRYVSEKTKRRVFEACRRLNYKPNVFAQGLRTKKTNIIGVTVATVSEPYLGQLVRNVEEELKKVNYHMFMGSYYFDTEEELKLIEGLERYMVDGIIAISGTDETNEVYERIATRIPVVFVSRQPGRYEIPRVCVDDRQLGIDAIDYLVSMGHSRIAYLTIPNENFGTLRSRQEGYIEGLRRNGIPYDANLILIDDNMRLNEIRTSIAVAKTVEAVGVTAVFVVSDYIAVGLLKGLSMIGIEVPAQLSILSVTNIDYCLITTPQLSSFDLSPKKASVEAVSLIHKMQSDVRSQHPHVVIPHKLVERETVASFPSR